MRGIRWRFLITVFIALSVPIVLLNRYTVSSFDRFTRTAQEEAMAATAALIGEQYKRLVIAGENDAPRGNDTEYAALLAFQARETQSRLQVLSPAGAVEFDTHVGDGDDTAGLADKPEVRRALAGDYGANWELTPDRSYVYYYCALPIVQDGRVVGVARVARHTGAITRAIVRLTRHQRLALAAALTFAAIIAAVMAQLLTRRLRLLAHHTRAYARGMSPPPPPPRGRDELAQLARAIHDMARQIEGRHRYNREVLSTVLHELRTPVTAIRGAVELLESGAAERADSRERFLGNIRFEADRLSQLVGELARLTRLDSEDLSERLEPLPYIRCINEALERLLPTFEAAHAPLELMLPARDVTVELVPARIEQVLANLLDNAFQHTPLDGRVTLTVERTTDGSVLTRVDDTGPGIAPADLDRVFEPFFTTHARDATTESGSGLGLAVARTIVERHRGSIRAERSPLGGARVSFTLPAAMP
jgi:signal transduction histidine kinase